MDLGTRDANAFYSILPSRTVYPVAVGVGVGRGVGIGVGFGVVFGVGFGVKMGVAAGVKTTIGVGVKTGVGRGVGIGVGLGVGTSVALGVKPGVGRGVGTIRGVAVGSVVAVGSAGVDVGSDSGGLHAANNSPIRARKIKGKLYDAIFMTCLFRLGLSPYVEGVDSYSDYLSSLLVPNAF